jgi:hypothetical protein
LARHDDHSFREVHAGDQPEWSTRSSKALVTINRDS